MLNEDDRNVLTVLKKKVERSKKFRTLNKVKSEKPRYDDITGTPIYPMGSGMSPDLDDLMYQLFDNQDYGPELNIMDIKSKSAVELIRSAAVFTPKQTKREQFQILQVTSQSVTTQA